MKPLICKRSVAQLKIFNLLPRGLSLLKIFQIRYYAALSLALNVSLEILKDPFLVLHVDIKRERREV